MYPPRPIGAIGPTWATTTGSGPSTSRLRGTPSRSSTSDATACRATSPCGRTGCCCRSTRRRYNRPISRAACARPTRRSIQRRSRSRPGIGCRRGRGDLRRQRSGAPEPGQGRGHRLRVAHRRSCRTRRTTALFIYVAVWTGGRVTTPPRGGGDRPAGSTAASRTDRRRGSRGHDPARPHGGACRRARRSARGGSAPAAADLRAAELRCRRRLRRRRAHLPSLPRGGRHSTRHGRLHDRGGGLASKCDAAGPRCRHGPRASSRSGSTTHRCVRSSACQPGGSSPRARPLPVPADAGEAVNRWGRDLRPWS
jgi:hypothetical protein